MVWDGVLSAQLAPRGPAVVLRGQGVRWKLVGGCRVGPGGLGKDRAGCSKGGGVALCPSCSTSSRSGES